MVLSRKVFHLTEGLPKGSSFVLKQQLHKTALSVPSNIAEGAGCTPRKELLRLLDIANGSLTELETQLILVRNLKCEDTSGLTEGDITIIRKMLHKFKRSIRSR